MNQVVVNKTGNDSKIADLLSELRKSFPQLDDWVNIYPTLPMKLLVAEVYQQVITFARHTSKYFTHFSSKEFSIFHPLLYIPSAKRPNRSCWKSFLQRQGSDDVSKMRS